MVTRINSSTFLGVFSLKRYLIVITVKAIDIIKLIVASESQNTKNYILQLGKKLFKLSNNSVLSSVLRLSFVQPENSLKILFSFLHDIQK